MTLTDESGVVPEKNKRTNLILLFVVVHVVVDSHCENVIGKL